MMPLVALIVWIFLMMAWLLGGGYYVYNGPNPTPFGWATSSFIPWACVFILGLFVFGAFGTPAGVTVPHH